MKIHCYLKYKIYAASASLSNDERLLFIWRGNFFFGGCRNFIFALSSLNRLSAASFPLSLPFFVMANENPLETEGVYTLPEAQIDRFLFKIKFGYPEDKDELRMMEENATFRRFEDIKIKSIMSPVKIIELQKL